MPENTFLNSDVKIEHSNSNASRKVPDDIVSIPNGIAEVVGDPLKVPVQPDKKLASKRVDKVIRPPKKNKLKVSANVTKDAEIIKSSAYAQNIALTLTADKTTKTSVDTPLRKLSSVETVPPSVSASSSSAEFGICEIITQGDINSKLKGDKAVKEDIDRAVRKKLLALKAGHEKATGSGVNLGDLSIPSTDVQPTSSSISVRDATVLNAAIVAKGDLVRKLHADNASNKNIEVVLKQLLALKSEYKVLTGSDWKPGSSSNKSSAPAIGGLWNQNLEVSLNSGQQSLDPRAQITAQPMAVGSKEFDSFVQSPYEKVVSDEFEHIQFLNGVSDSSVDLSFDEMKELIGSKVTQTKKDVNYAVPVVQDNVIIESNSAGNPQEGNVVEAQRPSAKLYSCSCGQQFNRLGWYSRHKKSCKEQHICEECNGVFKTKVVLKMHVDKVHKTLFKCQDCDFSVNTQKKLHKHFITFHKTCFNCKFCDRVFKTKDSLRKHTAKFHCKKQNQSKKQTREVPSVEGYKCTECPKSFKWPGSLRKHRAQHMKLKSEDQPVPLVQKSSSVISHSNLDHNLNDDSSICQNIDNLTTNGDPHHSETSQISGDSHRVKNIVTQTHSKVDLDEEVEVVLVNDDGSSQSLGYMSLVI